MSVALAKQSFARALSPASWKVFPSPLGWMALAYSREQLLGVTFGHSTPQQAQQSLQDHGQALQIDSEVSPPGWVARLEKQLVKLANGIPQDFAGVPLDTSHLTPLGKQIIEACGQIPWGEVLSYKQLAMRVGRPGAARAVGNVMANNRFPLVVPCHRVVGTAGSLGGYSAPGGLATKRKLLIAEGSLEVA